MDLWDFELIEMINYAYSMPRFLPNSKKVDTLLELGINWGGQKAKKTCIGK